MAFLSLILIALAQGENYTSAWFFVFPFAPLSSRIKDLFSLLMSINYAGKLADNHNGFITTVYVWAL